MLLSQNRKPKALLLSAYHTPSHNHWCKQLQNLLPKIDWVILTLPPRHFNWRLRGNSLSWAFGETDVLNQDYDFAVATSMVDVSSLRGFIPSLAAIPWLVYFHENQFAYPLSQQQKKQQKHLGTPVEAQLVPIYGALCAEQILFNSEFNRRTFLAGAEKLLKRFPDFVPSGLMQKLQQSAVLPVPISSDCLDSSMFSSNDEKQGVKDERKRKNLNIVWNHRWEYDKGPELLLAIVREAIARNLPLQFNIVGQQFRSQPAEFAEIRDLFDSPKDDNCAVNCTLGEFGYLDSRADYEALLWQGDIVLSTASHDFQGLSIQEGMMRNCTPLVPDSLVYPEYVSNECRYLAVEIETSQKDIPEQTEVATAIDISAKAAVDRLQQWVESAEKLPSNPLREFQPEYLAEQYRAAINALLN